MPLHQFQIKQPVKAEKDDIEINKTIDFYRGPTGLRKIVFKRFARTEIETILCLIQIGLQDVCKP